jgi:hypothetical protein
LRTSRDLAAGGRGGVDAQNALKRAGITSLGRSKSLGRDAISQVPGIGPLALARLFPSGEPQQRRPALSSDDLRRVKSWFDTLQEIAPLRLRDADRVLAEKIARCVD